MDSTHEVWLDFAVMIAAGQLEVLQHIECTMKRELATGSTLTRYNQEQEKDLSIAVGLWRQIITLVPPVLLIPEAIVKDLEDHVQSSLLDLAQAEPPDSIESALLSFLI